MLRVQLLAIAISIGANTFLHMSVMGRAPWSRLLFVDVLAYGFDLWWIASLLASRTRQASAEDAFAARRAHAFKVYWAGSVGSLLSFWLLMPFAGQEIRLLFTLLCIGPMAICAMGTVRPSAQGPRRLAETVLPAVIPIGLVGYFLIHPDPYRWLLITLIAVLCAGFLLFRETLQRLIDAAHAAMVEAQTQRDAKTRFLAAASHDLGQPLQAARLFFDQAIRNPPGPARDRAARNVHWAFDSTEQLLGQMLDHLRLESGHVEPKAETVAVGSLLTRVAELHEGAARLAGVSMVVLPTRHQVLADPVLLERVVMNLVGNAIRHAKARRILIGARRRGGRVRLWIIDDGVGIQPGDLPRLFDDYVQGSNHGDEIRGGFGLGLASARRMAGLMGGEVGLDRRWVNGSAFWVELAGASLIAGPEEARRAHEILPDRRRPRDDPRGHGRRRGVGLA